MRSNLGCCALTSCVLAASAAAHAQQSIAIDGRRVSAAPLDVLSTPTGSWPVYDLGEVDDGRAYLFGLKSRPDWFSLCIVRWPDGSGSIDDRPYRVEISGKASVITALPGSMKCLDNGEPVRPTIARLREAIKAGRVLPFDRSTFAGWPKTPGFAQRRREGDAGGYDPSRIYGRSSMNNAIGQVGGAGGEYPSSRGFLSGDDAGLIAAAVAGDEGVFNRQAATLRIHVLYGLSLPNLVIWSRNNPLLRDPQLPLKGDTTYTNTGHYFVGDTYANEGSWTAPADYPHLAAIDAEAGTTYKHTRDQAHLFNHGYAYWLATGDPRAAILMQAINAYSMAANYRRFAGRYLPRFSYQRTTLNQYNALWVLRDVAQNATSNGAMLWSRTRANKMIADMWSGWKTQIAALDRSTSAFDRSTSIFRGIDRNEDNAYSNFMIQGYGPDSAYLWASAGEPALLRRIAENMVLRFGRIGGARGFYGASSGAGFPILEKGAMPYRDTQTFIAWVNANSPHPTDSFDGAPAHYVLRAYWAMRFAADAVRRGWMEPVPGLDEAIRRTERARDATRSWKYAAIIGWKHGGRTF